MIKPFQGLSKVFLRSPGPPGLSSGSGLPGNPKEALKTTFEDLLKFEKAFKRLLESLGTP